MLDNKPYPLDLTNERQKGKALVKRIFEMVKETQSIIIRTLPDKLILTADQYNSIADRNEIMQMYQYSQFTDELKPGNGKVYVTPLNVMEIEVKGGLDEWKESTKKLQEESQ